MAYDTFSGPFPFPFDFDMVVVSSSGLPVLGLVNSFAAPNQGCSPRG